MSGFCDETASQKLICEVKARNELADDIVQAKAKAATSGAALPTLMQSRPAQTLALCPHPDDQVIGSPHWTPCCEVRPRSALSSSFSPEQRGQCRVH